jgi:Ca-activated chloride channel family protein
MNAAMKAMKAAMKAMKGMKAAWCLLAVAGMAFGDAGVLVPAGRDQPDPAIFSLNEMTIEIRIDNGIARVGVRQIFGNHSGTIQEGAYTFALPDRSSVSDFAVWDDLVRIPGVILERKRAEEIYSRVRAMQIDPGLLQMGERGAEEASRNQVFTAKIVPIPSFGTKRIELEYQERPAVERYESLLSVPLRPDAYQQQTAGHLTVTLELRSEHAIEDFAVVSKGYPLQVKEKTATYVRAEYFANNVPLSEDLSIRYRYAAADANSLKVVTQTENGENFFQAMTLLPARANLASAPAAGRTVVAVFDASLSMQWEKLERSYQATEALLKRLRPVDRFNLILFNSDTASFRPAPVAATMQNVEAALAFIKSNNIRGGTDLQKALAAGLAQTANQASGESYLVLVSDGGATAGAVNNGRLAKWYTGEWGKAREPHTFVFAVGDDANLPLVRMLAANHGVSEWVRSTEPIDFKLNAFLAKIGEEPVRGLALRTSPSGNFPFVYPIEDIRFAGSAATWVGQYTKPGAANFSVIGTPAAVSTTLPAQSNDHPYLPRAWARARVDALLDKIARDGEDAASIDEVIRLSKKYKFVTPYTSFLAVPRALLRPRVIRPGDPVLRVKTDASIVSVIAMFPFGLVKPMRFLDGEDAWQTRFLAPSDMNDGTYQVQLVLRDRQGRVYRETKSFVIASKAPAIRVRLGEPSVRAGGQITIAASASANTRTITARLWGAEPVSLRWNPGLKTNTGEMQIPAAMPAGKYKVVVTAEDIAHNITSEEVGLEIR